MHLPAEKCLFLQKNALSCRKLRFLGGGTGREITEGFQGSIIKKATQLSFHKIGNATRNTLARTPLPHARRWQGQLIRCRKECERGGCDWGASDTTNDLKSLTAISPKTTIRTKMITNENPEILFCCRFRNGGGNLIPPTFSFALAFIMIMLGTHKPQQTTLTNKNKIPEIFFRFSSRNSTARKS